MPPGRKTGSQCLCTSTGHNHIGRCQNKVWGRNTRGYLFKVCDTCRISMTLSDPPPPEQPISEQPRAGTPRSEKLPQPPNQPGRPFSIDPLWREPF